MIRKLMALGALSITTAAQATNMDGPSLPLEQFADVSSYDAPIRPGVLPAESQIAQMVGFFSYPVFADEMQTLPQLVEGSANTPLWQGNVTLGIFQRVYPRNVELHWLASVDRPAGKATLCKLVVNADRLPPGATVNPGRLLGLLIPSKCQFASSKPLPIGLLSRFGSRGRAVLPMKAPSRKSFPAKGRAKWQATVVTASSGVPDNFALLKKEWGGNDASVAVQVPAIAARRSDRRSWKLFRNRPPVRCQSWHCLALFRAEPDEGL